jgi:cell shape-determining protein MreD
MRERFLLGANFFLLGIATLVLGTAQSALWFQIFGWFPAPAFWIPVIVYAALYRQLGQMAIIAFLMSLILRPMTVMPVPFLFFVLFLIGCTVRMVKQRFYWIGHSYFMMVSGIATFIFHIYHFIGSLAIGGGSGMEISNWLVQALLTPLAAPVLYETFRWFDRVTEFEQPTEASADIV